MSCGKTHTRRQVHGHKRIVIIGKHKVQQGGHKSGKPPKPKVTGHKRIVISHPPPKPKQKITKKQVKQKIQPKSKRRKLPAWLLAWEKRHPFKDDWAAWKKAHPLKDRKHTITHKVHCHIKTRHAVVQKRHQPKGKRIVITHPLPRAAVKGAKGQRAQKARRAVRAR